MKSTLILFTLFILLTVSGLVNGQKGLKLGFGTFILPSNNSKQKVEGFLDEIHVKTPIGFSFNVDYALNDKLSFKSGLEYKFQNINTNKSFNFRAEFFSIPLLLNYNFYKSEKRKLKLGITSGISLDRLVYYSENYIIQSSNDNLINHVAIDITSNNYLPTKSLQFKDFSFRVGLNLIKNLGSKGQLNLFANYTLPFTDPFWVNTYFTRKIVSPPNLEITFEYEKNVNVTHKGLILGAYYTFGTLTFK